MSTRVHWHHCWRGSPICENGGDVCCGVTPLSILWACLHLALYHLLRYHCQNRATTGLLARVVLLKNTMTSTLSFFYIVTDSPKSQMHWSNYWHSVTGPEHGKWHQNVPPTLSPSQPILARRAKPFPFPWEKHYVMREKMTALRDYYRHWRRQQESLLLFHGNPQYEIYGHLQEFSRDEKLGRILRTFTGSDQNILRIERFPNRSRSKT